ncbi:MAG: hypothetical protein GY796_03580 [Chloroflexi bacterium]|nr:hypothetical protein [Chloroflexota bacterium]
MEILLNPELVIPAKAGIHLFSRVDSRLHGNDKLKFMGLFNPHSLIFLVIKVTVTSSKGSSHFMICFKYLAQIGSIWQIEAAFLPRNLSGVEIVGFFSKKRFGMTETGIVANLQNFFDPRLRRGGGRPPEPPRGQRGGFAA